METLFLSLNTNATVIIIYNLTTLTNQLSFFNIFWLYARLAYNFLLFQLLFLLAFMTLFHHLVNNALTFIYKNDSPNLLVHLLDDFVLLLIDYLEKEF